MSATPLPPPPPAPAKNRVNLPRLLAVALGLVAVAGVAYWVLVRQNAEEPSVDLGNQLKGYLERQSEYDTLGDGYADADDDLVADPPADKAKLLDPDAIVFSVVGSDDPAVAEFRWGKLMAAIGEATGKKVVYLSQPSGKDDDGGKTRAVETAGQIAALKDGKLHVTAFNTGLVRQAVNTAGFVPLFCPANEAGEYGYTMNVIVPDDSPVADLAGLKGQTIAFTAMSSNSGAKVPLVVLKEHGMLPSRDYTYAISGGHVNSIFGVCYGKQAVLRVDPEDPNKVVPEFKAEDRKNKWAAACVASDLLEREKATGRIKPELYKTIFTSQKFPPLCFGVPYNLDPAVRQKIEQVFAEFRIDGSNPIQKKFVRVDYKKDWERAREIDDKLATLLTE